MQRGTETGNGSAGPASPSGVDVLSTALKESLSDGQAPRNAAAQPASEPQGNEHRSERNATDKEPDRSIKDRAALTAELADRIRRKLASKMPEAVQAELAKLLGLVPEASGSNSLCLCEFELAVDALLADAPKLELARGLRMKFEEQMWQKRLGGRLLKALPATRVVFGLLVTSILLIPAVIWSTSTHFAEPNPDTFDMDLLVLVCCFGAFGAVTSIMVRLRSFDSIHAPPLTLFLTGLFRPFIGGLFAAFTLVLLESRFLNLPDATVVYFALAIAFVAGFSERFGEDLTAMVAKKIEPPPAQAQQGAPSS